MPTPILITFEEAAWEVVSRETRRPEMRAAIERGRVSAGEEGRPIREVAVTGEDLQDVDSILMAVNQTLVPGKDAAPAVAACSRALKEVRSVLRAVRRGLLG